jgi:hypothetical protein
MNTNIISGQDCSHRPFGRHFLASIREYSCSFVAKNNSSLAHCPSVTVSNWSAATSFNLCVTPLGQRISISFTVFSGPNPK